MSYVRFAFASDLHLDRRRPERGARWDRFFGELADAAPDVVVLGGDLVGLSKDEELRELGRRLEQAVPGALRVAVPGNHDLWQEQPEDTERYYDDELRALYREAAGLHMLDGAPLVIDGGVGIAGSLGWYDYSLKDPDLALRPGDSYEDKRFCGHRVWNDARWTRLRDGDRAFCDRLRERLRADIAELRRAGAKSIVAVTHTLAFAEMARTVHEKPLWTFAQAYHGTTAMGDMLLEQEEVGLHLCGHTHLPAEIAVGDGAQRMESINVGGGYDRPRLVVRDVDAV